MANSAKMEGRPAGASEGARRATGEAPAGRTPDRGRFSAQRKADAVLRLLRGEDLETLSRSLGGTLDVDLLYGFRPQAGQAFDILNFDPAALTGEFDAIDLPDLGGGLAWDTSNLYTTGAIGVVPEPATLALLAMGLAALAAKRSRAGRSCQVGVGESDTVSPCK